MGYGMGIQYCTMPGLSLAGHDMTWHCIRTGISARICQRKQHRHSKIIPSRPPTAERVAPPKTQIAVRDSRRLGEPCCVRSWVGGPGRDMHQLEFREKGSLHRQSLRTFFSF